MTPSEPVNQVSELKARAEAAIAAARAAQAEAEAAIARAEAAQGAAQAAA
ncbi:HlyD family secretion protein, partial [Cryobacterium fucosi]